MFTQVMEDRSPSWRRRLPRGCGIGRSGPTQAKKLYLAAALALPLLATSARADGWILPFHGSASVNFRWNINCGSTTGGGYQLGPWLHHYWPLEAHFG